MPPGYDCHNSDTFSAATFWSDRQHRYSMMPPGYDCHHSDTFSAATFWSGSQHIDSIDHLVKAVVTLVYVVLPPSGQAVSTGISCSHLVKAVITKMH